MVTSSGPPSGYTRSVIKYLSGTPTTEQWGSTNEAFIRLYLLSFTSSVTILPLITAGFDHADGGGTCTKGELTLSPFAVGHGADTFASAFRDEIVAARAVQTGVVKGTYLSRFTAATLAERVQAKLRAYGEAVHGELIGAAVVDFPGELRIGGEALDMPPFLMEPPVSAAPFTPVAADPDNPAMNQHTIRVVQLWFATGPEPDDPEDPDARQFTARIGIQFAGDIPGPRGGYRLGDQLTVPGAIKQEVQSRRDDSPLNYAPHEVMAQWLADWADRQSS